MLAKEFTFVRAPIVTETPMPARAMATATSTRVNAARRAGVGRTIEEHKSYGNYSSFYSLFLLSSPPFNPPIRPQNPSRPPLLLAPRVVNPSCSFQNGLWLSLVERLPRVQEAAGSNPASPRLHLE